MIRENQPKRTKEKIKRRTWLKRKSKLYAQNANKAFQVLIVFAMALSYYLTKSVDNVLYFACILYVIKLTSK